MIARALTIAGSDPSGGAGIQQDLRTFGALGVWGMTAITSLTVQDTQAVHARHDVDPAVVRAQIDAVVADIGVDAVKTGMLPTAAVIEAVSKALQAHDIARVVVDPVLVSSTGGALADEDTVFAIRELLLPRALVVTPNAPEAHQLTGIEVDSTDAQRAAARGLVALGAGNALVTGGHLGDGPVTDVLALDDGTIVEFTSPRIETEHTHGTGCVLSAALAASLAQGAAVTQACERAREVVQRALRNARALGKGRGPVDPGWGEGAERA